MKTTLTALLFAVILLPQPTAVSASTLPAFDLLGFDLPIDRRSNHCPKQGTPTTNPRCRGV